MSTELYTVIILIMFFGAMFLTMIFSIHFEDVLIYLMSGLISSVIAFIAVIPVMSFDEFSHTSSTSQISVQEINKISPRITLTHYLMSHIRIQKILTEG